jgi:hypothetical protein
VLGGTPTEEHSHAYLVVHLALFLQLKTLGREPANQLFGVFAPARFKGEKYFRAVHLPARRDRSW